MDILSSRILLHPIVPSRSRRFYRETLGLAVAREFGPVDSPSLVFFLGGGFLELSGQAAAAASSIALWLQVRNVADEYERLRVLDVALLREPRVEPWGLVEAWIEDPDGLRIVLVEVPPDHPLRRDSR